MEKIKEEHNIKKKKDVDIEWIYNIPFSWELKRVKNLFYISKQKAHIQNPVVLSLARSGVKVRDISNNEGQLAESYEEYNPVIPGDLLLNPMDLYSGANCSMSEVSGVISPAYINLRAIDNNVNSKFYDYYFKVQYWSMAMFAHGKGVSYDNRWTINRETILNYYLPYISFDKQNDIVKLLNDKLLKISKMIEIEEQQIEKLKEYKQSLITEAVTKGLDKNAEMKDSGVEWIGKIPKDWQVIKLKYIATSNDESIAESDIDDRVIKYVDIGSVSLENGVEHIEEIKLKDAPSRARRITKEGDLIVSTVRTYLKAIATINEPNIIVSTGFCVIRNKSAINNKYLEYACKSDFFTNMVSSQSIGVNYPSISSYQLMNLCIVVPEIKAQETMIVFLNNKISKIEKMINTKKEKIEKLNEYKKSLIYEYVTGKKEV